MSDVQMVWARLQEPVSESETSSGPRTNLREKLFPLAWENSVSGT